MANLKDIRKKIKTVENTKKTTNAMKLVSISKLKKAQEIRNSSKRFAEVVEEIARKISAVDDLVDLSRVPFLKKVNNLKVVDIIFVTTNKGLCGAFSINVLKETKVLIDKYTNDGVKVRLRGLGKKGIEYFKFNGINIHEVLVYGDTTLDINESFSLIKGVIDDFVHGKSDKVVVVHNTYFSSLVNRVKITELLPISDNLGLNVKNEKNNDSHLTIEAYDQIELLNKFIDSYLKHNFYYILIDSITAEHSARVQSMDAASKNASEMVSDLQLKYNKYRQEAITNELIEIISGVEASK